MFQSVLQVLKRLSLRKTSNNTRDMQTQTVSCILNISLKFDLSANNLNCAICYYLHVDLEEY